MDPQVNLTGPEFDWFPPQFGPFYIFTKTPKRNPLKSLSKPQPKMAAAAAMSAGKRRQGYGAVKQVTKTNFSSVLQQIRAHIKQSDFIAVSSQKTGDFSSSSTWRRILPIDTPEIAYLKSKVAADTFQLLQFAVCPFSIHGSKVLAFP